MKKWWHLPRNRIVGSSHCMAKAIALGQILAHFCQCPDKMWKQNLFQTFCDLTSEMITMSKSNTAFLFNQAKMSGSSDDSLEFEPFITSDSDVDSPVVAQKLDSVMGVEDSFDEPGFRKTSNGAILISSPGEATANTRLCRKIDDLYPVCVRQRHYESDIQEGISADIDIMSRRLGFRGSQYYRGPPTVSRKPELPPPPPSPPVPMVNLGSDGASNMLTPSPYDIDLALNQLCLQHRRLQQLILSEASYQLQQSIPATTFQYTNLDLFTPPCFLL